MPFNSNVYCTKSFDLNVIESSFLVLYKCPTVNMTFLIPTQLYHGENKLIINEMVMRFALYYAELNFYSASSLKQQSADRLAA